MSSDPEMRTGLSKESKHTHTKDSDLRNKKMNLSHLSSYVIQDPVPYESILAYEGIGFSVNELVELGDDSLGLVVLLTSTCSSSVTLGVISFVLKERGKIILEKVINPKTKKINLGLRTFHFGQVLNIEVLGIDEEARHRLTKDSREKCQGKKLLRKKQLPIKVKGSQREKEVCEDNIPTSTMLKTPLPPSPPPPPPAKLPRPSEWVVIDALDDVYVKALGVIDKESVISVGHSCIGFGRDGSLVLLSVATSSMIFHFDVAEMGVGDALDAGIGRVLGDQRVVKVMHDCRPLEDLLHHQFKINLTNVYDTQATEIYLQLQYKQEVPRLVSTLPSLIRKYLNFTPYSLLEKVDSSSLMERPIGDSLGERLAVEIMYLREVRLEQLNLMLSDLRRVTEVYMGTFRDKDTIDTDKIEESNLVPSEVVRECKKKVR